MSEASGERSRGSLRGRHHVLPGFGLALGITLVYLTAIVIIPLGGLVLKMSAASWTHVWEAVASPRAVASLQLTVGAALAAATVNAVFGLLVAWVLVRYQLSGQAHRRCDDRSAVRAADGGGGHRADDGVFA